MKNSSTITQSLQDVLRSGGLPESAADQVAYTGADPVFRTQYKVTTAGSAALGAMAIAMADIREAQTRERPSIAIDVNGVSASLRSSKYVRVDGSPPEREKVVTGFYASADGRWNYFHCNHPPHQQALLGVLGVDADKTKVAQATATWDAFELENAVHQAGGLAPVVRTPEEWRALPNTPALAAEPLVHIRKIGDSKPIPLPRGVGRAMQGLKVLDLTRVLAGPTCARLLAESGADVLKITCEQHPDSDALEWDTGYAKRKLTLDIATPEGKAKFAELLKDCDVLSQAYRPGALAKLGFGPEQAHIIRPGIICVNLNAFGHTGAWKMRRGFDTVVQAASGMAHTAGRGKEPKLAPVSALDYIAGYLMTFGALVALKRRSEEGGSYEINVSLARCAQWLVELGLHDTATADAGADELAQIKDWLIDVPTPLGKLTRLRPIVRYSDQSMNELIAWDHPGNVKAAWLP